jgi:D-alanyl-lipoteichoic acid acyltransferase DltB (MBOAT superfamily)
MAIELLVAAIAALAGLRWVPVSGARREWLLIAFSCAFIAYQQPFALIVSVALVLGTWALLRDELRGRIPRAAIVGGLALTLVLLRDVPELRQVWAHRSLAWPIPLGISFLVLRLIGVTMDATALGTPVGARQLLLLSTFFPTYRSGPITTLHSFQPLPPESVDVRRAADRIVLGLARKCLLADLLLAPIVHRWSAVSVDELSPEQCLLFPFLSGLWIYWDFAGYSDIAIGLAALLGYRVPENFDRPYQSRNPMEFWRRWHMTLSDWIRSRVFLKLTGRRPSVWRVCASAAASMVLCGLWHGPRGGYFVWGVWHGLGIAATLAVGAAERRHPWLQAVLGQRWAAWLATAATYVWVSLAWLPFLLGMSRAWRVAATAADALLHPRDALLLAGLAGILLLLSRLAAVAAHRWKQGVPEPLRGAAYALVAAAAIASGSEPFVYWRF